MTLTSWLWIETLAGPVVWFLAMWTDFAVSGWACPFRWKPVMLIVSFIALLITSACGFIAWKQWRKVGREEPGEWTH